MKDETLHVGGMMCSRCETTIENGLAALPGVAEVHANRRTGDVLVAYDGVDFDHASVCDTVVSLGYTVLSDEAAARRKPALRIAGLIVVAVALFVVMQVFGMPSVFNDFPEAGEATGYAMLFLIGVLTSLHCVGMCGGIGISQSLSSCQRQKTLRSGMVKPSFLYNLGRLVSYTCIGAVVGAVGSVLAFDAAAKGVIQLAAGVFMVVMGLSMLGFLPRLPKLTVLPFPVRRLFGSLRARNSSPFIVGLLNGFMPCGPLQSMQIYALSTGSAFAGAASMFAFALGTVPLMFGLGAISALLGRTFAKRAMTVGSVFVMALGLFMFSSGLALAGVQNPVDALRSFATPAAHEAVIEGGVQYVKTELDPGTYPDIVVKAGVPVRWEIQADADNINGCNNRFMIPLFDVEHSFSPGTNVVEFTPTETGTFAYSCWMGMISATVTVEP